jgi:hypothetical protein
MINKKTRDKSRERPRHISKRRITDKCFAIMPYLLAIAMGIASIGDFYPYNISMNISLSIKHFLKRLRNKIKKITKLTFSFDTQR